MRNLIGRLWREKQAQDLVEYALLAAVIAVGVLLAVNGVANALNTQFTSIAAQVGGAGGGSGSGGTSPSPAAGAASGSAASGASGSGSSGNGSGNNGNHAGGGNNGNSRGNGA